MDRNTTCAEVKARAEAKISEIRERKKALGRMEKALGRLSAACRGKGPTGECPILEALEDGRKRP